MDLTLKKPTMVDMPLNPTQPNHIYLIYMYKKDLKLKKTYNG